MAGLLVRWITGVLFFAIGFLWAVFVVVTTVVTTLFGGKKGITSFFEKKDHSKLPDVAKAVDVQHDFVSTKSGMKFEYVHAGEADKPLMLCMHGFPECWYSWRYLIEKFRDRYHIVAFHSRGYGNSDKPKEINKYHMNYLVNDVAEIIEALGYPRATLVAHDWGGAIAWEVPKYFPHLVDKVIIMNAPNTTAARKGIGFSQFLKSWYICLYQMPYLPELLVQSKDFGLLGSAFNGKKMGIKNKSNKLTREEIDVYKHYIGNNISGPLNYYRAINPIYRGFGLKAKTRKVVHPVLLIWGDQDAALGKELAELAKGGATDITVAMIPGASHWVNQDEPEKVHEQMEKFLMQNQ
nr:epoxide hydrolase 1 [Ciona intestinalis]|eukprot:XP_009861776.1 epoxide hydrolase 1 [Ciona intestinalis]